MKSERIDEDDPNNRKPSYSGQQLDATRELTASDTDGSLEHAVLRLRSSSSNDAKSGTQSSQQHSPDITTPANESLCLLEDYFAIQLDRDGKPVLLGAGGMGYVMIGKPLVGGALQAIKVCNDPKHEPRRRREFEILSKLPYEGFPFATGSFRDAKGNLCYSMKLVKGESLLTGFQAFHRLAEDSQANDNAAIQFVENYLLVQRPPGGFRPQDLSEIFTGLLARFIDVATAVSTMHGEGFIHRDLKPENVRIEARTRQSVILDFGLAKMQGQPDLWADTQDFQIADSMSSDLTRAGVVLGTFAYMSPEQASGNAHEHSKSTDIYALGAMLYYLITGNYTVLERDSQGTLRNVHQVLKQIREGTIEPPVRLSAIRADFADLEAICSKAIATDPEKRYGSVDEMIIDLRAWSAGNPVKAYRDTVTGTARLKYDFHHWKRQNTGLWNQAVTAALAVFTAGGGAGAYFMNENAKAGRAAVTAERSLSTLTTEVNDELTKYIGGSEVRDLKALPVEKLDLLVAGGNFDVSFRTFLKKTLEELRTKVLQEDDVLSYRGFGVVADIYREATELEKRLTDIESLFEARVKNRELVRAELEEFRQEFAPIRDFLGNDFGLTLSGTPQGRIDAALGKFLPAFEPCRERADTLSSGRVELFFPDCSEDVRNLMVVLTAREISTAEVREVCEAVSTLLTYKVLNVRYYPYSGYPPESKPYLESARRYLAEARELKGGAPSFVDLVYWERVETALRGPSSKYLRERLQSIEEGVGRGEIDKLNLTVPELAALGRRLDDKWRHDDAVKVFDYLLSLSEPAGSSNSSASSEYIGEVGRGCALVQAASQRLSAGRTDEAYRNLISADGAFNQALGILKRLSGDNRDRNSLLASMYLKLADVRVLMFYVSRNSGERAEMEDALQRAEELSPSATLYLKWGTNLFYFGDSEAAIKKLSKALELEPSLEARLLPWRASSYARLKDEDLMQTDIARIRAINYKSREDGSLQVEPYDLFVATMAVAEYSTLIVDDVDENTLQKFNQQIKDLLTEVLNSCERGHPFRLDQLDLEWDFFKAFKARNPEFCEAFSSRIKELSLQLKD